LARFRKLLLVALQIFERHLSLYGYIPKRSSRGKYYLKYIVHVMYTIV